MSKPAARVGDMHTCPMLTPGLPPVPHIGGPILPPGVPTVIIGGMPAATVSNQCICVAPPPLDIILTGSTTVFIGGKPAATVGSTTSHGGTIILGCLSVLINGVGHHSQEQDFSCVIASSRNLIEHVTGQDNLESNLRDEVRNIMGDPDHDFNVQGINPIHASQLLDNHGVPNTVESNVTNDRLMELTEDNPVLVGFPGHRVMLESVSEDINGNRTYNVRDPDPSYGGQPRYMNETDFNSEYNRNAIVIIPN